jgi:hypothetical protein
MEQLSFIWFESVVNKETEEIYGRIRVPRTQGRADSSLSDSHAPVQDVTEALCQAREALNRVRSEDLSHPASLEIRLDQLGAALAEVPRIKNKIKGVAGNSFGSVLEELARVKIVRRSAIKQLEKLESILASFGDYAILPSEGWSDLSGAVDSLCEDLNNLINELEFQAEEED